jgi:putative tryptophan/tyrosine transport system substrate-binding protein
MLPLFFLLLILLLASCKDAQLSKSYTVGIVNLNAQHDTIIHGFKKGLAEYGYIEGENITYLYNGSRAKTSELEDDLQSFIKDNKADLILSITTPATKKAKLMTAGKGIPVVFTSVFNPVQSGIVQSLVKPGGNLTGIKVGGNSAKALEWLLKISPQIKNIGVPFNGNNSATIQSLHDLQNAADRIGIMLAVHEVDNIKELELLFKNLPPEIDALWLLNSYFLVKHTEQFVKAATKHRLPLGSSTSQVAGGVMVTYGQNAFRTGELAAGLAHEIFQGSSPATLPVEVTDFFLGINLKTADTIGIDISDDILQVADTIIRP